MGGAGGELGRIGIFVRVGSLIGAATHRDGGVGLGDGGAVDEGIVLGGRQAGLAGETVGILIGSGGCDRFLHGGVGFYRRSRDGLALGNGGSGLTGECIGQQQREQENRRLGEVLEGAGRVQLRAAKQVHEDSGMEFRS